MSKDRQPDETLAEVNAVAEILETKLRRAGFAEYIVVAIKKVAPDAADCFTHASYSQAAFGNMLIGLLTTYMSGMDAARVMAMLVSNSELRKHMGAPTPAFQAPDTDQGAEAEPADTKEWVN